MTNSPFDDSSDFTSEKTVWTGSGESGVVSTTSGAVRKYLPGDVVDNSYQLLKLLGRGGMGVVFSCKHLVLGKTYALKVLSGEKLTNEHWLRFQAEAKSLARLNHNGIVGIHNMGIDQGLCPYLVMDLLSGESLDVLLRKEEYLPVDLALKLFIGLADALSCAHQHGIVHRDIKPGNLMVIRDSQDAITMLKLMDFGIARLTAGDGVSQSQTATGAVFGTPFYMSPEQIEGGKVDERSDVYSFGCTLFEVLTGRPPFVGGNPFETFSQHQTMEPPRLSVIAPEAGISEGVELVVKKLLAKKAIDRYQAMSQVKRDLERLLLGRPVLEQAFQYSTVNKGTATEEVSSTTDNLKSGSAGRRNLVWVLAGSLVFSSLFALGTLLFNHKADPIRSDSEQPKTAANLPEKLQPPPPEVSDSYNPISDFASAASYDVVKDEDLVAVGATPSEIAAVHKVDWVAFGLNKSDFEKRLRDHIEAVKSTPRASVFHMRGLGKDSGFYFPEDIILCHSSIDERPVQPCVGDVKAPPNSNRRLIFGSRTKSFGCLLDPLGPEEVDSIELVFKDLDHVISVLKRWKKLRSLSFFNSISKALPGHEDYDESSPDIKHLKVVDGFTNLESLGVCGDKITVDDLLAMKILPRLKELRLKRVSNLPQLLRRLPERSSLESIWIVGCSLSDEDLKLLLKMRSLKSIRIRRSKLSTASAETFSKMPALKELWLDRPWTDAEKGRFHAAVPAARFESVTNVSYWKVFP